MDESTEVLMFHVLHPNMSVMDDHEGSAQPNDLPLDGVWLAGSTARRRCEWWCAGRKRLFGLRPATEKKSELSTRDLATT